MANKTLTPDQKRGIWQVVLTFLKLIFKIGEKHVEKHVLNTDNSQSNVENK